MVQAGPQGPRPVNWCGSLTLLHTCVQHIGGVVLIQLNQANYVMQLADRVVDVAC